jgi:hypothetical protein
LGKVQKNAFTVHDNSFSNSRVVICGQTDMAKLIQYSLANPKFRLIRTGCKKK